MKLQSKKTGEIGYLYANKDENYNVLEENGKVLAVYATLAEVADEWQDYEEPATFWYIDDYETMCGSVGETQNLEYSIYTEAQVEKLRTIGNYFKTKEEAEKAVEKLKAWQRLKDNGFEFTGWKRDEKYYGDFTITATDQTSCNDKDLDLLFGGE